MYELTEEEKTYSKEDQEYILARNSLIPEAENRTRWRMNYHTKRRNIPEHTIEYRDLWSKIFLESMDKLAKEEGFV